MQAGASIAEVEYHPIVQAILSYDQIAPATRDNLARHLPQLPEPLVQLIAIQSLPELKEGFGSQQDNIDTCFAQIRELLPYNLRQDFYNLTQAHVDRKPLQSLRAQVQYSIEACNDNDVYAKDPAAIDQIRPILDQLLRYTQHLEDYPAYAQNSNGNAAALQQSNPPQPADAQALPVALNMPNNVRGLDMSSSLDATNPRRWGPRLQDSNRSSSGQVDPSLAATIQAEQGIAPSQ